MKIKVLRSRAEQIIGLQGLKEIPADTVYVFIGPFLDGVFHSRNVPEPFDLIFLDSKLEIVRRRRMVPPNDTAEVPPLDVWYAVEAKAGVLDRFII